MLTKKNRFIQAGKNIPHSKVYHYDVLILGGGPAGLTAAIYSSRYGMKTGLISRDIGGSANLAERIENYPGFAGSGFELMQKFYKQAKEHGVEFLDDDVIKLEKDINGFVVYTTSHKFIHSRSIIVCLGTKRRKLNIKGEDKFLGKGVSYCATCDASFFKGKNVAVIGGSDSACVDSIILSGVAREVYIIYRGREVRCEEILRQKLKNKKNVKIICDSAPIEIRGKDSVSELIIDKSGEKEKINLSGVFIDVGSLPVSDIAKMLKIKLDSEGFIKVDNHMHTNVSGVFAAGDVVKSKLKQVLVAAAQGAMAAKSAHDYLNKK